MDKEIADLQATLTQVARYVKYRTDGNGRGLEVDDLVQDAMFAIWRNLDDIMIKEHRRSKAGYLRQYARLAMLDAVRKWAGRGNGYLNGSMVPADDPRFETEVEEGLNRLHAPDALRHAEMCQAIDTWWQGLVGLEKRLMTARFEHDLSAAELAARYKLSEHSVMRHIRNCRVRLEGALA